MYTRLHNYTNMVVAEHGIQTFKTVVVIVVLIIWCFGPHKCITSVLFDFCPNICKCQSVASRCTLEFEVKPSQRVSPCVWIVEDLQAISSFYDWFMFKTQNVGGVIGYFYLILHVYSSTLWVGKSHIVWYRFL